MYLPENNAQMFDILTDLRVYAAMNGMPKLAEKLDDALMLLLAEGRGPTAVAAEGRTGQALGRPQPRKQPYGFHMRSIRDPYAKSAAISAA